MITVPVRRPGVALASDSAGRSGCLLMCTRTSGRTFVAEGGTGSLTTTTGPAPTVTVRRTRRHRAPRRTTEVSGLPRRKPCRAHGVRRLRPGCAFGNAAAAGPPDWGGEGGEWASASTATTCTSGRAARKTRSSSRLHRHGTRFRHGRPAPAACRSLSSRAPRGRSRGLPPPRREAWPAACGAVVEHAAPRSR